MASSPTTEHEEQDSKRHIRSVVEEEEQKDYISLLPNALLFALLSLLPIKECARTCVLSRRWRDVWTETPLQLNDAALHLDNKPSTSRTSRPKRTKKGSRPKRTKKGKTARTSSLPQDEDEDGWCRRVFFGIVATHNGPINSCRVSRFDHPIYYPTVDRIIECLENKCLQSLHLSFSSYYSKSGYKLPQFLLPYRSLKKLNLYFCQVPDSPYTSSMFPHLTEIDFKFVCLNDEFVGCILSSCLHLEIMKLFKCTGLNKVRVSSPKLRVFLHDVLRQLDRLEELIIDDAPNLEELLLGEFTTQQTKVTVHNAPKLRQFGFICFHLVSNNIFRIGEAWFKFSEESNLVYGGSSILPTMNSVAIRMNFNDAKHKSMLLFLLQSFPRLESLSIMAEKNYPRGGVVENNWNLEGSFEFLNHIKTFTLKCFEGSQPQIDFINLVVSRGVKMEKINLLYDCMDLITKGWIMKNARLFNYQGRASNNLKFEFSEDFRAAPAFSAWNHLLS